MSDDGGGDGHLKSSVTPGARHVAATSLRRQMNKDKDRERFELMINELVRNWNASDPKWRNSGVQHVADRTGFILALQSVCAASSKPGSFKSSASIRSQLQAEFIHLHYAKTGEDFFPSKMNLIHTRETAGFTAATDALYLTQLATKTRDQRLFQNAAQSYRGALQLLRKDLSKPKAAYDDHLLGTIHVLSLCEAFKGMAMDDTGQNQHTKGAALLFQSRGPESMQNVYIMIQLQQHHHRVLLDGLLTRNRPLIGRGRWLDVEKNCRLKLTSLTTLALRVPGALEDADKLLTQGTKAKMDDILDMLTRLKVLETQLQSWMTAWYAEIKALPFRTVASSTLSWLPHPSPFALALEFPTPLAAKAHVLFWMPLLSLRETLKQVAELHPYPLVAITMPLQNERLHATINECADNLCMTAMYLTNPLNGFDGLMEACGPLLLAFKWFEKVGAHDKLRWCYRMFEHIESHGVRAPNVVEL